MDFQCLAVVPPRLAIPPRRSFLLQTEVRRPQAIQVVDVVQERREPLLAVPFGCLPYPLQRTGRAVPARSPGRVLLAQVSFGRSPSLHLLRRRLPGVVRRLRRYYRTVRFPVPVHRGLRGRLSRESAGGLDVEGRGGAGLRRRSPARRARLELLDVRLQRAQAVAGVAHDEEVHAHQDEEQDEQHDPEGLDEHGRASER